MVVFEFILYPLLDWLTLRVIRYSFIFAYMRPLFLFLSLLSFFTNKNCVAQQAFDITKFKLESWDLPVVKDNFIKQPIAGIEVIDARPDTFCLGFRRADALKMVTQNPLSQYVGIVLNSSLQNQFQNILVSNVISFGYGYNLLLAVREFWMYEDPDPKDFKYQTTPYNCAVLFRADVYLKRESGYIPLFKIDSVYGISKGLKYAKNKLMDSLYYYLAEKINKTPISLVFEKATKSKSKTSIDSFYRNVNVLPRPIISDTSKQYFFKTFQHFKSGNYGAASYNIVSDNMGDFVYKMEPDGRELLSRDFIFFNKGKYYLSKFDSYSEIFFNHNRAYFLGSNLKADRSFPLPNMDISNLGYGKPQFGGMEIKGKVKRSYQPMMLDMVTGNTY